MRRIIYSKDCMNNQMYYLVAKNNCGGQVCFTVVTEEMWEEQPLGSVVDKSTDRLELEREAEQRNEWEQKSWEEYLEEEDK